MLFHRLLLSILPFTSLIKALPSHGGSTLEDRQLDIPIIGDIITSLGDLISDTILGEIISYLVLNPVVSSDFPGLLAILQQAKNESTTGEDFCRGLLSSIKTHSAFDTAYSELDADLQAKVTAFIEGESAASIINKRDFHIPPSPAAKQHFKRMEESGTTSISRRWLNSKRDTSPIIYEDDAQTKPMAVSNQFKIIFCSTHLEHADAAMIEVYVSAEFHNWGLTVSNVPAYTFVPTTVKGLENLITWAKTQGKRVRAAGYRHTWTNMYSESGEIFVSMLDLTTATTVPDPSSILPNSASNAQNEFKQIELATTDVSGSGGKKRLARIGAAVTNEEFRRWAIANNAWTMPYNVVMVE